MLRDMTINLYPLTIFYLVNDTNKEEFVVKEGFGIAARQIGAGQLAYPERGRFYLVYKMWAKPMRSLPRE